MSYRSRHGSIGTKGFSLRTGIPGLSYRQNWGKGSGAVVALAALAMVAVVAAVQLLIYLIPILWQCISWLVLTTYDLFAYGVQQFKAWRGRPSG